MAPQFIQFNPQSESFNQGYQTTANLDNIFNQAIQMKLAYQQQQDQRQALMQHLQMQQQDSMAQRNLQQAQLGFNPATVTQGDFQAAQDPNGVAPGTGPVRTSGNLSGLTAYLQQQKQKRGMDLSQEASKTDLMAAQAEAARAKANGVGDNYNLDQAAFAMVPGGQPQDIARAKAQLQGLYPNGQVPKDYVHMNATAGNTQFKMGEQQDQYDNRRWSELSKRVNPANAPRGSLVGLAGLANMRADRALQILNKPGDITPQEKNLVIVDLAGIMKGGVPDEAEMRQQNYGTYMDQFEMWKQKITQKPAMLQQPEIRARLIDLVTQLKQVDNKVISDNIQTNSSGYEDIISKDPNRFKNMSNLVLKTTQAPGEALGQKAPVPGAEWKVPKSGQPGWFVRVPGGWSPVK